MGMGCAHEIYACALMTEDAARDARGNIYARYFRARRWMIRHAPGGMPTGRHDEAGDEFPHKRHAKKARVRSFSFAYSRRRFITAAPS